MKLKTMTPINIGLNTRSLEEEKREMETEFRSRILKLLKEDEEFRYMVTGLIGLEDIRRGQIELREPIARLEKSHGRLEESHRALEESHRRLEESVANLNDAVARLAEEQRRVSRTLRSITRYIEEVSITLEEEARSMIELRLRQRGIQIKLGALIRPYVELDIYGSNDNPTVIGGIETSLAPRHVRELERKLELVKRNEPELLKGKTIKTIYAMWAHPEAVEECKAREIWLNTPNKELTQPDI